mmetsp:Transcript_21471/g.33710  ORF Transcript_21471/g.33710 Transcript_21471/m.33710 type:complete len:703 (+) Transcript_21471:78-2186(+)
MTTYTVGNDVQALVADIGSYSTKIGYAGDDHPQAMHSSTTAAVKSQNQSSSNFAKHPKRDFTLRCVDGANGDGDYDLVNPVDPVTGWLFSPPSKNSASSSLSANNEQSSTTALSDAWESHELVNSYLQHAFQQSMGLSRGNNTGETESSIDYSHHHPLLLLDKSHTPPALRQRLLEIMFETHNLPSVFFLRDAIAACYAVGRTTATVVDVGYSGTMVTPVYEGFVERSGVLRNNACGARNIEERVLEMMDGMVVSQGGRKRKERMRRRAKEKLELQQQQQQQQQQKSAVEQPSPKKAKRDDKGHFIKEKGISAASVSIPDYLMPLYQVRRANYNPRKDPFHAWSRLALAREIKECGLGVAVGPMGYVSSSATPGEDTSADAAAAAAAAVGEGGAVVNPAAANNMFLTAAKFPYTLPDGTNVEISTTSRCDVVELYFGNDEQNSLYRDNVFDETVQKLEEYSKEVEDFIAEGEDDEDETNEGGSKGITSGSAAKGDPYSNTSYRGEKSSRYAGSRRNNKKTHYSPNVISTKLYSACLPYLRTEPPNGPLEEGGVSNVNDNYFHFLTSASPAQMVCDAVYRCDRDQQAKLLGDVVVCGGGACITGASGVVGSSALGGGGTVGGTSLLGDEQAFPDRLREEVEAIVHKHTMGWRVKVTSPNISERAICSWLGGSILGSLGTFQDMWISKQDYEEYGAAIVNRKCP